MRIVEEEERAAEEREQPPPPLEPEETMLPLVDRKEPRETPPPFGSAPFPSSTGDRPRLPVSTYPSRLPPPPVPVPLVSSEFPASTLPSSRPLLHPAHTDPAPSSYSRPDPVRHVTSYSDFYPGGLSGTAASTPLVAAPPSTSSPVHSAAQACRKPSLGPAHAFYGDGVAQVVRFCPVAFPSKSAKLQQLTLNCLAQAARALELRQRTLAPPSEASEAPSAWSEPVVAPGPLDSIAEATHRRSNTMWDCEPALPAPESFLSAAQRARPGPARSSDAGPGPPPASTAASPAFSRRSPNPALFATSQTRMPSSSPSRTPTKPSAGPPPAPAFYTSLVPGGPLLPFYASPASTPGQPVSYVSPAGASALPPPPAQPVYASVAAGGAYPFPSVSSGAPVTFPSSTHRGSPAASPTPPVAQQRQHAPQGLAALRPWSRSSTVSPGSVSSHAGEGADASAPAGRAHRMSTIRNLFGRKGGKGAALGEGEGVGLGRMEEEVAGLAEGGQRVRSR